MKQIVPVRKDTGQNSRPGRERTNMIQKTYHITDYTKEKLNDVLTEAASPTTENISVK